MIICLSLFFSFLTLFFFCPSTLLCFYFFLLFLPVSYVSFPLPFPKGFWRPPYCSLSRPRMDWRWFRDWRQQDKTAWWRYWWRVFWTSELGPLRREGSPIVSCSTLSSCYPYEITKVTLPDLWANQQDLKSSWKSLRRAEFDEKQCLFLCLGGKMNGTWPRWRRCGWAVKRT